MLRGALASALAADGQGIVRVPALVKGQLRYPQPVSRDLLETRCREIAAPGGGQVQSFRLGDTYVIPERQPLALDGPEATRFVLLPYADAPSLVEADASQLADDLLRLPIREVLDYLGAIRDVLMDASRLLGEAATLSQSAMTLDRRSLHLSFQMLPFLLDPDAVGEAIDRELGMPGVPGRQFFDAWVPVPSRVHRGMSSRTRDALFPNSQVPDADADGTVCIRAVPTRQLHVTAGNSPLLPFLSWLRALATKGAAVIKCPAEATATTAVLALAMDAVDPRHPIARHSSLVYWKGGDRQVEDVLLAPNVFDRLVVWGSSKRSGISCHGPPI